MLRTLERLLSLLVIQPFKSVDGVLLSADGKKLIAYPNGKAGSPSTNPAYQGVTGQPNASVYKVPEEWSL